MNDPWCKYSVFCQSVNGFVAQNVGRLGAAPCVAHCVSDRRLGEELPRLNDDDRLLLRLVDVRLLADEREDVRSGFVGGVDLREVELVAADRASVIDLRR